MWPIVFRDVGLVVNKSYALIESRLFSFSHVALKTTSSAWNAKAYERRRTDEDWHKKLLAMQREASRRTRAKHPESVTKDNERSRERYATDFRFKLSKLLSVWTRNHAWVREELPWKSHRPVLYTSPVQHRCESCGITRRGGLLLVWQSIAQPDSYSCQSCYLNQDMEACMPKGYEDVRDLGELVARKKKLDDQRSETSRSGGTVIGGKD